MLFTPNLELRGARPLELGAVGAVLPPDLGRNFSRAGQIMPPPRIFRPSYGPGEGNRGIGIDKQLEQLTNLAVRLLHNYYILLYSLGLDLAYCSISEEDLNLICYGGKKIKENDAFLG